MTLEKRNNIEEDILKTPKMQFDGRRDMGILLTAIAKEIQQVEDAIFDTLEKTSISNAFGVQLDLLGKDIGELRYGRDDEDYRAAILARIISNSSSGEPESIYQAIRSLYSVITIRYIGVYPASYDLYINLNYFNDRIRPLVNSLTLAGVKYPNITISVGNKPLIMSEVIERTADYVVNTNVNNMDEYQYLKVDKEENISYNLTIDYYGNDIEEGFGLSEIVLVENNLLVNDKLYTVNDDHTTYLNLELSDSNENYIYAYRGGELAEVI